MERVYIIALDTHCAFTEVGVLTAGGRVRARGRCATTIPALIEEVGRVPRPRAVASLAGIHKPWTKTCRRKGATGSSLPVPARAGKPPVASARELYRRNSGARKQADAFRTNSTARQQHRRVLFGDTL